MKTSNSSVTHKIDEYTSTLKPTCGQFELRHRLLFRNMKL